MEPWHTTCLFLFTFNRSNIKTRSWHYRCDIFGGDMSVALVALLVSLGTVTADMGGANPPYGTCLCVQGSNINVRSGRKSVYHVITFLVTLWRPHTSAYHIAQQFALVCGKNCGLAFSSLKNMRNVTITAERIFSLVCGKFCVKLFAEQSDTRVSLLRCAVAFSLSVGL